MDKIPVDVRYSVTADGIVSPLEVTWGDGRAWKIERVLHTCRSSDHSFEGVRYTVLIGGVEKYLYNTGSQWYVYASA